MALLRPCSTAAGFTATPERERRVDMPLLKRSADAAGFAVVVDAKVVLIVRDTEGVESSVYQDGKVLLKTDDRGAAEAAYTRLRPVLENSWA